MTSPRHNDPSPRRWRDRVARAFGRDDALPIDPDLDVADPAEPSRTHRPARATFRRSSPDVLVSIAVGGFLGALARYGVATAWPVRSGAFPWTTFFVNTSGAFAIGVILTLILERLPPNRILRPLTCVGFLGAWTTMSTLVTESAVLIKDDHTGIALAYMAATLGAGLVATTVGIAIARRPGAAA